MSRTNKTRAFTLLEILIVLAIVSVLAAILFGVLARMREKGRSAVCQGNLKQIALALQQYVQDNDGRYPIIDRWESTVSSYTKSTQIFQCPSEPIPPGTDPALGTFNDYTYNYARLNAVSMSLITGVHESTLAKVANLIITGDEVEGDSPRAEANTACGPGEWSTLHSGGANYLFYDGHIKWLNPDAVANIYCADLTSSGIQP